MKIIVAPDKFKGSLDSFAVCEAVRAGLLRSIPPAEVLLFPMADGGDGFASVMKFYAHTTTVSCKATDPLGRSIDAHYEWDPAAKRAYIELAVASGLVLLQQNERDPMKTSTAGTGQLIKHAIAHGAKTIVLGLGGSATNDAGTGILEALGFTFLDAHDAVLIANGGNLSAIQTILPPIPLPSVKFEIACDVTNTLFGANGAAQVYAPQKGAGPAQVAALDHGLRHLSRIIAQTTGKEVATIPGSGAAGGIAAGLMSYFDVSMLNGVEMIASISGIASRIRDADLIVTGEGRIDEQSGSGKVVGFIAEMAKRSGIPCMGVCGHSTLTRQQVHELGLTTIVRITDRQPDMVTAMRDARSLLEEAVAACSF